METSNSRVGRATKSSRKATERTTKKMMMRGKTSQKAPTGAAGKARAPTGAMLGTKTAPPTQNGRPIAGGHATSIPLLSPTTRAATLARATALGLVEARAQEASPSHHPRLQGLTTSGNTKMTGRTVDGKRTHHGAKAAAKVRDRTIRVEGTTTGDGLLVPKGPYKRECLLFLWRAG